jgi:hypothetical protein
LRTGQLFCCDKPGMLKRQKRKTEAIFIQEQ